MKKEVANKWVVALRSGNYKQGRNSLRNNDKFCCLGVLCDISGLSEWGEDNSYFDNFDFLPVKVMKWAVMKSSAGLIADGRSLAVFNDNGESFEYIADFIEKHWKEL